MVSAEESAGRFRLDFHACLAAGAEELPELADAVLCADGPVRTLAGLSLTSEHRRGHGALYAAINHGQIDIGRLRRSLAGPRLPRAADGRLLLAADVSNWLQPGCACRKPEPPGHMHYSSPSAWSRVWGQALDVGLAGGAMIFGLWA